MKRLTLISLILTIIFASCRELGEVRIMPEFNYNAKEVDLYKDKDYSKTILITTTAEDVIAEYNSTWLSVDANKQRIIYTTLEANETGETRSTTVKLIAGEFTMDVKVNQLAKGELEDKSLKFGQLTEDGLGMIFWIDPENPEVGKAISLTRWGGNPFEATVKAHNALSKINGVANTALFTDAGANDAAALCTSLGEGWYLPASNEFGQLFDVYNGVSRDNGFTNAVPGSISDAEKAARAAFEKIITELGGEPINADVETGNGNSYWTSTENEAGDKAYWARFGKWACDAGAKTSTARFVRAMKVVGDYQFPEDPATITVTPSILDLTSENGASGEVTVKTNKASFSYLINDDAKAWLSAQTNGDKIVFTALSANETEADRVATVTVTAGSGDTAASATVTITQKKLATFKVGEYVKTNDYEGIVFWVDGKNAKILNLKRSENPVNFTENEDQYKKLSLGLTSEDDGEANTNIMKSCSIASNLPILACVPDGWYIPARNEMEAVFNAYNGGPASASGLKPNAITETEKAARAAWDKILTDNGGDVMNAQAETATGDSYYTSTESSDASKVFYVRFGQWNPGLTGAKAANSPSRYVRCIRKISK